MWKRLSNVVQKIIHNQNRIPREKNVDEENISSRDYWVVWEKKKTWAVNYVFSFRVLSRVTGCAVAVASATETWTVFNLSKYNSLFQGSNILLQHLRYSIFNVLSLQHVNDRDSPHIPFLYYLSIAMIHRES